jgi:hypothetical protein
LFIILIVLDQDVEGDISNDEDKDGRQPDQPRQ